LVAIIIPDGSSEDRLMRYVVLMRSLALVAAADHLLAALADYKAAILVLVIMEIPFAKPRFARSFPEIERPKHGFEKL
jgi:hypothetical protein